MAHINITKSKKGMLQAKIQAYGKDPVTCKPKLFTRRIYNEDGLTEAKFKKYVEKVSIEFEETVKTEFQEGVTAARNRVLTFSELMKEWQKTVLNTQSISYYRRICEVDRRFTAYLTEQQLANRPLSEITVRDVQLFLNGFTQKRTEKTDKAELIKPLPKQVSFRELAREGILTRVSSYSMNNCGAKILLEKAKAICEFYGLEFDEYFKQEEIERTYALETIKGYRRVLRALFNEAVRYEWITKNPVCGTKIVTGNNNSSLTPVSEKEVYSFKECREFIKALDDLPPEYIYRRVTTKFMLLTGVRTCELHGLKWSKFDFEKKIVRIDKNRMYAPEFGTYEKGTKSTTSERDIPLTDDLIAELRAYMEWFRLADADFDNKLDDYYFAVNIYREPEGTGSIGQWLKRFEQKNGFKKVTCHGLRHTYCSIMLARNVPVNTVSKYMGHADPTITLKVYAHFIPDTVDTALLILSELTADG